MELVPDVESYFEGFMFEITCLQSLMSKNPSKKNVVTTIYKTRSITKMLANEIHICNFLVVKGTMIDPV